MPAHYVIPSLFPWPKQCYGLPLGETIAMMEGSGKYFTEVGLNADQLGTFGFRYKLENGPYQDHVAPLIRIYASLYPHAILPEEFIVPPTAPWPQELYGFRIGKIVSWSSHFIYHDEQ